jgi:hypothetical protein
MDWNAEVGMRNAERLGNSEAGKLGGSEVGRQRNWNAEVGMRPPAHRGGAYAPVGSRKKSPKVIWVVNSMSWLGQPSPGEP